MAGWGGICVVLQPATRIPPQPAALKLQHTLKPASACHTDTTPASHTKTPTHIETTTHNQCDDTIEKSQAPDDGCIDPLTPNHPYSGCTTPLTSKRCILYIEQIQVLNILNMIYTLRFFLFKMQFVSYF